MSTSNTRRIRSTKRFPKTLQVTVSDNMDDRIKDCEEYSELGFSLSAIIRQLLNEALQARASQ